MSCRHLLALESRPQMKCGLYQVALMPLGLDEFQPVRAEGQEKEVKGNWPSEAGRREMRLPSWRQHRLSRNHSELLYAKLLMSKIEMIRSSVLRIVIIALSAGGQISDRRKAPRQGCTSLNDGLGIDLA